MLWFDEAKDYGFILTDDGERLYVDRAAFVDGAAPVGRCAGRPVELRVEERSGKRIAVDVSLVHDEAPDVPAAAPRPFGRDRNGRRHFMCIAALLDVSISRRSTALA